MSTPSSVETATAHLVGPGRLNVINGCVAYTPVGGKATRLDLRALHHLLLYGRISLSDEALRLLLGAGVQVACLNKGGHACRGRLVRHDAAALNLRLAQYHCLHDPAARLDLARQVVLDKIQSQREAARHYQRQGRLSQARTALDRLTHARRSARQAADLDQLRAAEGQASQAWFRCLDELVRPHWSFPARRRRPPTDPINALLSLGYTLLAQRITARGQAQGLEIALGMLHDLHPGRPSLTCDLIEPLRVPAVDRWVIGLCRRRSIAAADFHHCPQRGTRLRPARFADILATFEQHLQTIDLTARLDRTVGTFVQRLRYHAGGRQAGLPCRENPETVA